MTTPEEILEKALETLDEFGWCQHAMQNYDGSVCSIGAIRKAAFGVADSGRPERSRRHLWNSKVGDGLSIDGHTAAYEARERLRSVLPGAEPSIVQWNDAPGRTAEDVKLAFKKAIAGDGECTEIPVVWVKVCAR